MHTRWHAAALALLALVAAGCTSGTTVADDREGEFSGKLVLTGSSTIAPMVAEIAKRFEARHPAVRIDVQTGGTSRGIADALSGVAQIAMGSRALQSDEEAKGLVTHLIAIDGVCLIAHRDNPVASMTDEQVVAIYTGQIANWKEVGGPDAEIVVANKAAGRATLEVFLDYFRIDAADVEADVIVGENQHAIKTVAGNPGAIGYVSVGEAEREVAAGTAVKLLAAGGTVPSTEHVASGAFPITRPLNLFTHGEPDDLAEAFIEFAQSEDVHDLIEAQQFVPIRR